MPSISLFRSLFPTTLLVGACTIARDPSPVAPPEKQIQATVESESRTDLRSTPEPAKSSDEPRSLESDPARPPGVIYRDEIERATQGGRAAYLLSQLGPIAFRPKGRFQGWQITKIFPADPKLCQNCDLKLGDIVLSINGQVIEQPEQLSLFINELPQKNQLVLKLLRNDQIVVLHYAIIERKNAG